MAVPLIGDDSESCDEAVMTVGLSAACASGGAKSALRMLRDEGGMMRLVTKEESKVRSTFHVAP